MKYCLGIGGEIVSPSDFGDLCLDSRILISKIDSFLFWTGGTEYESWEYCGQGGEGG